MKQLEMTPELSALIKSRVGQDVDTTKLAVFETIALNTKPLPGKRGSFFDRAVVKPVTLAQMVQYVNDGNTLPLMADHELFGAPNGRVFHAALELGDDNELEMRQLFYLDETEVKNIAKLNAGTLDEVSVQFLATAAECSECAFDYFQMGTSHHFDTLTCANGHTIGEDGVHVNLIGLNQFIETSLVARGAADKPKIVGKSEAKLAPGTAQRLAAKGFEPDALVVRASMGHKEEFKMDMTAALTQVSTLSTTVGELTAKLSAAEGTRDTAVAEVTALKAEKATLEGQVTALTAEKEELSKRPEATVGSERDEAVAYLQEQLNHLRVAKGETKLEGDALPKEVAKLKADIGTLTDNLTSILPVGGRSNATNDKGDDTTKLTADASAFTVRK